MDAHPSRRQSLEGSAGRAVLTPTVTLSASAVSKVYLGAPPRNFIEGVQTFNVPARGGMIFEFVADVEGEFPFVNHGFGHGQKGAIGFLVVEP